MAFTFHQSSCVIAGTFNIYIIRPDWLGQIGLLPEGSELEIQYETQLNQPGFRLSSPRLNARWTVLPNRLVLETDDQNANCGESVDKILESLPWTPLMGLGLNVAYRGDRRDVDGWDAKTTFPSTQIGDGDELKARTWHVAIKHGDQIFNLQMSETDETIELRANVHTDLRNRQIDFARATAMQFFEHRQTAKLLMRDIFSARFDDGNNDE